MSALEPIGPPFQPAFCHRNDCQADSGSPFCSACGADIAAYLKATSPAPAEPATQRLVTVQAPVVAAPAPPAPRAAPVEAGRVAWRDPAVLAAFACASSVGALASVLAGLA
jgi:hypothetical protein